MDRSMTRKDQNNIQIHLIHLPERGAHQMAFILGATAGIAGSLWAARRIQTRSAASLPAFTRWERRWSRELGAPAAAHRAELARQRYNALIAACMHYAQPVLRARLEKEILPGLAVYQTLLAEGFCSEEAVKEVTTCITADNPGMRIPQALNFLPRPFAIFRRLIKQQTRLLCPPEGFSIRWLADDSQKVEFHVYRCFFWDVLRGYGAGELTTAFCQTDDVMAAGMSKGIEFKRSQTLGRGGELCDFCYNQRGK
jgi:uncharacterized protein YoaH (UPF0181 family)